MFGLKNILHPYYYWTESKRMHRYAGLLPKSPCIRQEFFRKQHEQCKARINASTEHKPSVERFGAAINGDPVMASLFEKVFLQAYPVPDTHLINNFDELLYHLDVVVSQAPVFCIAKDQKGNEIGEPIGCPMFLLLDRLSNTQAAYDLFRMPAFNGAMKDLLDTWGEYLTTPASASVLTDGPDGWLSPGAIQMLEDGRGSFDETYILPDPIAIHKGFESWDAFFTREFKPDARPIAGIHNPTIIHATCEATVYNIAYNVKLHDRFWLKAQPYSLYDMLDGDEYASRFVGGTVYQGYLSPEDYHRWHAPLNGTVVRTTKIPGSYFAALPDEGAPDGDPAFKPGDPYGAADRSQGWLTSTSARALIFIEADNTDIGLVCFIGVDMSEVSTCELLVKEGDRVCPGQQIGMFHYGGSSHVLVFGPHVEIMFADAVKKDAHVLINSVLCRAQQRKA